MNANYTDNQIKEASEYFVWEKLQFQVFNRGQELYKWELAGQREAMSFCLYDSLRDDRSYIFLLGLLIQNTI